MSALLEVTDLQAGWSGVPVVHELSLVVDEGEVVSVLGRNGAGKTTTMLAVVGAIAPLAGEVRLAGEPLTGPVERRARRGVAFVPEGRSVFPSLTTAENLRLGRGSVDRALELFPELEPLLDRRAAMLSGGEQQMLSLARALAPRPRLLVTDEISLGLAPLVVERVLEGIRRAAEEGAGVLLVEQQVHRALAWSHRTIVLDRGRVVLETDRGIDALADIERAYLGAAD